MRKLDGREALNNRGTEIVDAEILPEVRTGTDDIRCSVVEVGSFVTIIDYREREWCRNRHDDVRHLIDCRLPHHPGGIDVREHDDVVTALAYLHVELRDPFARVFILNSEELIRRA